jgi:uncharacterized Zn finger protein
MARATEGSRRDRDGVEAVTGRENAEAKGRRYLVEGRLLVVRVDSNGIEATCRGNGETYRLGHNGTAWGCTCPARGVCAHLTALRLVTVAPKAGAA